MHWETIEWNKITDNWDQRLKLMEMKILLNITKANKVG
uniref:Uncharacterized protein n=1 Tax=Nelumbo nucifera TaxID=4432 RepID=A0A822YUU8_NELNU|nr:TPA_asm: hypothetical protein HUJ06_005156 [Nelumbo nucifera]